MLQLTMGPPESGMGWLEWSSSVIGSTAWPIALVVIALIFRGQITKLIKRIKGAKYGDAEVSFAEELDKVEQIAPAVPHPVEAERQQMPAAAEHGGAVREGEDPPLTLRAQYKVSSSLQDYLAHMPQALVLASWSEVEKELRKLAERHKIDLGGQLRGGMPMAIKLFKRSILDRETMDQINEMSKLRNAAAHNEEVNAIDAYRFENLSKELVARLEAL